MVDLLVQNWELIVGLAPIILATILQLCTDHPDNAGGVSGFVLAAIDLLSILVDLGSASSPRSMRGVRIKIPVLQRSPEAESEMRRRIEQLKRGY